MILRRSCIIALLLLWVIAPPVAAQNAPFGSGNNPLEITADKSLEWDRANQKFIARVNTLAVQGTSSVSAQTLTAKYRSSAKSDIDIHLLTAEGDVKITNQTSVAYGDHATYDLDQGLAVITGDNLRLISPDQTITAQDRFEYWVAEGRAIAIGRPRVIRPKPTGGQDTLEADEIIATFKNNSQGARVIDILEAKNNVVITMKSEIITGSYGIYHAATNQAELTGTVTITRGPNTLEGNRAIVDLTTNISTIYGDPNAAPGQKGRVKGVFYPGSEKKSEPAQPSPSPSYIAPLTPPQKTTPIPAAPTNPAISEIEIIPLPPENETAPLTGPIE